MVCQPISKPHENMATYEIIIETNSVMAYLPGVVRNLRLWSVVRVGYYWHPIVAVVFAPRCSNLTSLVWVACSAVVGVGERTSPLEAFVGCVYVVTVKVDFVGVH